MVQPFLAKTCLSLVYKKIENICIKSKKAYLSIFVSDILGFESLAFPTKNAGRVRIAG